MKQSSKLLRHLDLLVNPRVGIIKELREIFKDGSTPEFFRYFSDCCDARALNPWLVDPNFNEAGGAALTRKKALLKAVGEALERYSSSFYTPRDLPLFAHANAPTKCVAPSQFVSYASNQYGPENQYQPFTDSTPARWTHALDMRDKSVIYVPACCVYLPYIYFLGDGEVPIIQVVSTGLACHDTFEKAAISAICEVVERDAFTIVWQAMVSPPKINQKSLGLELQERIKRIKAANYDLEIFNITLDHGIPTVLSVLRGIDSGKTVPLVFAGSTGITFTDAIRSSLEELPHTERFMHQLMTSSPLLSGDPTLVVAGQNDHLLYWANRDNRGFADFIFASDTIQNLQDIEVPQRDDVAALDWMAASIANVGATPILRDVTSSDLNSLGISVVRSIIPEFHPLRFGHKYRTLGGERLWSVPQQLGYPGITKESGDNPAPHPYP